MLLHIADAGLLGTNGLALLDGLLAGDHPEQGGLAAAIVSHQPDFIPFPHVEGHALEQPAFPKMLAQRMGR